MTERRDALIIDTSVAIKWIIEEEDSEAALALQDTDLAAPALLRIEAANVLRNLVARQQITAVQALELFKFLQLAPVEIVDHDDDLERRALEIALELQHPIYDCIYLALAERIEHRLITADRRFLRALAGSRHGSRAIHLTAWSR